MGTTATVIAGDASTALLEWATNELERFEQSWSRFRAGSDLTAANATANEWTPITPLLAIALERAARLWKATGGAFDPTILRSLEAAGYDRSFEKVVRDDPTATIASAVTPGFEHVELDVPGLRLRLRDGARLDLGGVGKGLAADLLAEGLVDRGARSALVSVGGDIRAVGDLPENGWSIPVLRPDGTPWFEHVLSNGALVQSTFALRSWTRDGRELHHIIDPRTGAPAESDLLTVVVAGAEAWWAEGFAKAAIVLGRDRGLPLLASRGLEAWT